MIRPSFQAHIELLQFFLARRDHVVENIQGTLNAQRRPIDSLQDSARLSRQFEDCFYGLRGITQGQSRLRGQLEDAHWTSGFRPRALPGLHNGLVEPAEMMIRGFHLWRQTHWPGRNGRARYAHTLFNLYAIRCLALLSMRVWDGESGDAGDRLSQLQGVLDQLWAATPADQPVLVRDARWLIPLAQSPATDDLAAYFDVAAKVGQTLSKEDRTAVLVAGVRMSGGHLRSQIRYYSTKNAVGLDDRSVILSTRSSNALDFALLIQDLVPLLEAYEEAVQRGDVQTRLELADTILQGVSPDPELFLDRVDLLGAYSMIEPLFITTDPDGHPDHTTVGARHVQLVQEYAARIRRVSKPLHEDAPRFRPVAGTYSPYGLLYGFSSDLLEHMVLKATQPDAVTHLGLEDVFVSGDGAVLAWVSGWRKLPHLTREVREQFDYPQSFAEEVFDRMERTLRRCAFDDGTRAGAQTGRLFILPAVPGAVDPEVSAIPDLSNVYTRSSDRRMVTAGRAEHRDELQLSSDRREGRCLLSYRTADGWVAITKAVLTDVLGEGHDAKVVGLPAPAAGVLQLMYPGFVVVPTGDGVAGRKPREGSPSGI